MNLDEQLLDKSKEAFLMAIELYNKPTIRYRVEGFSMFICNAWELMLKAHMIRKFGETSIYYTDHPDRTLALTDCIKKIFTNEKDPLRLNLEKIVELRNTSTHFITEEYEMVYVPLFQACVLNFNDKMMDFHGVDMTSVVPQNFLTLSATMQGLSESEFTAKYPDAIANKLLSLKNSIDDISIKSANARFAITINVNHLLTKDPKRADATYRIAKEGETPVAVIKELKDPNTVFPYSAKRALLILQDKLHRKHIDLQYNGKPTVFNNFHFNNFVNHFGIKQMKKLCYIHTMYSSPLYSYSQQAIDFIFTELEKDPEHILDKIKEKR